MLKDLINPTNFNILLGKLDDVLVKALDQPLGYAINWKNLVFVACASRNSLL